jgi:hypothetical protein
MDLTTGEWTVMNLNAAGRCSTGTCAGSRGEHRRAVERVRAGCGCTTGVTARGAVHSRPKKARVQQRPPSPFDNTTLYGRLVARAGEAPYELPRPAGSRSSRRGSPGGTRSARRRSVVPRSIRRRSPTTSPRSGTSGWLRASRPTSRATSTMTTGTGPGARRTRTRGRRCSGVLQAQRARDDEQHGAAGQLYSGANGRAQGENARNYSIASQREPQGVRPGDARPQLRDATAAANTGIGMDDASYQAFSRHWGWHRWHGH